ncbi:hypothetical protein OG978_45105 (plasmid) [Streptomyces sp. NBC_01591]|nr:hypothetical protein [Streptomyces sp. NBC_01591]WSD74268.1 hypothetical protein OG978_45105 [Streptomyces sp. NBC_01591]
MVAPGNAAHLAALCHRIAAESESSPAPAPASADIPTPDRMTPA